MAYVAYVLKLGQRQHSLPFYVFRFVEYMTEIHGVLAFFLKRNESFDQILIVLSNLIFA